MGIFSRIFSNKKNEYIYSYSDVWLLQSIAYAAGNTDATLEDIIAKGDVINHSIFTPGELQQGFYRLLNGNLIIWRNNKFSLTEFAKNKLLKAFENSVSILDERDEIASLINASPWLPNQPSPDFNPDLKPETFSLKDYEKACKQYSENFRKIAMDLDNEEN